MELRIERDTADYLHFDFSSWRSAVSQRRTAGYPLILRAAETVSPSLRALPYLQFGLHAASVAAFFVGLRRYGFGPWSAFAAASTLLYSGFVFEYAPAALTDAPALSLAVFALGFLAAVVGRGGVVAWTGVTLSTALAYHVRPAYLFLLPLIPALGLAIAWLQPATRSRAAWLQLIGGLCLAAAG
ncbi:MAG: hypothetical protein KY475_16820, partial [Planctomycetes bacterium]|nr:hypothetical protein [Planctomycetota bacterium]